MRKNYVNISVHLGSNRIAAERLAFLDRVAIREDLLRDGKPARSAALLWLLKRAMRESGFTPPLPPPPAPDPLAR